MLAHPKQNGNKSWVEFTKFWIKEQELADKSLKIFGSLRDALSYLYFIAAG